MIGQKVSHYKILEKLGEGGMGVVYKAEDTRLHRIVALKFLPPNAIESEAEKQRFMREARAAAGLDHPNIATIYGLEEAAGQTFISMAYVEGRDLRELIDEGPARIERALEIAIQVAEGLEAAHERKVVHRDVKSANVMVTDRGQVKIMDFGLAKLDGAHDPERASTMGTVAYMSPEQTRGDDVDHRSDIWSLGVIIYEMIVGLRPFRGNYEQSVIYSICNEEPEPVTALRTGVPMELERIIAKCLAKDLRSRYQGMAEVLEDLRRLRVQLESGEISKRGMTLTPRRRLRNVVLPTAVFAVAVIAVSGYFLKFVQREAIGSQIPIAVADFVNETGESGLDGLSGMLITALEQSRWLSVFTRTSMFDALKQMGKENVDHIDESLAREICRHAGINVLVVASINKFDDLYTIDLKAYDMDRPGHLFTTKEEGRGRSSIPSMIDKVASKTRKSLNENSAAIRLASEPIAEVTTTNLDAYQQYFLGEQLLDHLKFEAAKDAFKKAVELDSLFALAHYRLAYANWWEHESEQIQRAQLAKALSVKSRLPEKYRYLLRAQSAVNSEGYEAGLEILRGMESIYPDDKEMLYNIGDYSFHNKQYEQAAQYLERVLEMDPSFERALNHLTMTYTAMRDVDKALAVGQRYANVSDSREAYRLLANVHVMAGDRQAALATIEAGRKAYPDYPLMDHQLAMVRCLNDEFAEAKRILNELRESEDRRVQRLSQRSLMGADLYMGRYRDALQDAERMIELSLEAGDSVEAALFYQMRGFIHLMGWRDGAAARTEMDEAAAVFDSIDPDRVKGELVRRYWANLSLSLLLQGDHEGSARIAEAHVRDDAALYDRMRFFSAWSEGDIDEAGEILETVLKNDEDQAMVLYFLAVGQMEHGRIDEAISSLERLQSQTHFSGARPFFYPASYYLLSLSCERKGDTRAALEHCRRFLDMWKNADADLPMLLEAKETVRTLEAAASQ